MPRSREELDAVPITEDGVMAAISAEAVAAEAEAEAKKLAQQDERAIKLWNDRIKHAVKHDDDARKGYVDDRKYAKGDTDWLVDTNLIGAILEILTSFIYAKDPDLSVKPSAAVGSGRIQQMTKVAKTIEVCLSTLLKKARLKAQAKRWIRSAMTVGVGWMKAALQTKTLVDPIMESRINDLRDNLLLLEERQSSLAAGDSPDDDAEKSAIRTQILALQAQRERRVAEGVVLDFVSAEDLIVSPECGELENYLQAPWIDFVSYKPKFEAIGLTDWPDNEENRAKLKSANVYLQRERKGENDGGGAGTIASTKYSIAGDGEGQTVDGFVKFHEIWSLRDGQVFTLIEGVDKYARQPYAPLTGARFYPCFQIAFHYVDGERHPQSDVHLLKKLQNEYASIRSNYAEHRRRSIPGLIFDETALDTKSVEKLNGAVLQEMTGVKTTNGLPLSQAIINKPYAAVDPGLYDTNAIRVDMEKMSGAQDAQQGSVAVEKTLGEAEIQQSGFMARTGARKDAVEDALTEISEYVAQLILQAMETDMAVKLAGPEAVWVQMGVEEAQTMFNIEVKAGSTGKPSKNMDKQTWSTLLPLIQGMQAQVGAAREQGKEWAAKPAIALLRETAQRLDDRIDVDSLLPVPPPPGPPQPEPVTELDKAKIPAAEAHAYLYRSQGVVALAEIGLPPEAGEPPAAGGQIADVLAALTGGAGGEQPGGPIATPEVPDPGALTSVA